MVLASQHNHTPLRGWGGDGQWEHRDVRVRVGANVALMVLIVVACVVLPAYFAPSHVF